MFERFTDRSRRTVVLAQEEARTLNHNYIGTEHFLLGLIHEGEGIAAQSLRSLGVSLEGARQQVIDLVGCGQQPAPSGHIPFTPRCKRVMELGLNEALTLGHNFIGTEHLLLALEREGGGVAVQMLRRLGVEGRQIRHEVLRRIGEPVVKAPPDARLFRLTAHPSSVVDADGVQFPDGTVAVRYRGAQAGTFVYASIEGLMANLGGRLDWR